jgi:DNA gyrase/topoisomerase IV subunit A
MKKQTTSEYILDTSRDYSIYVCQNRGIPSVSDGLKDSQRKALFVLKKINGEIKTISLVGELISSNVYLHGDASASEMISLMAAPYANNVTLIQGIGSFGTRVGPTDWGAPRYTYVHKSSYTDQLIYQDYDIVPMKENYDGSVLEPINFLPLIPMVLLNGVSGIAVGWSTEILPHKLSDIIDATVAAIEGKKWEPLKPCFEYLDCTVKTLSENSWEFTGKVRKDGNVLWVEELPPDLSLEKFKARLNDMEEEGSIATYIDRSTDHIKIEVKFKRGVIDRWTQEECVNYLKLRSKASQRLVVLDWDGTNIRQFANTTELIQEFVKWRYGFYILRYEKLIRDLTVELNFNLALKMCYEQKLPEYLPKADDRAGVMARVKAIVANKLILTDEQYDRIVALPSYRWAKDGYKTVCDKVKALQDEIAGYQAILKDPKAIQKVYKTEVSALKKLPALVR